MKTKTLKIAAFLAASLFFADKTFAQNYSVVQNNNICSTEIRYCNNEIIQEAVQEILLDEMTVWVHPTTQEVTYASSCRNQSGGCEAHIERVVGIIFDLSCASQYDPFTILAMAKHESNYNPFAVNRSSGAVGLLQLMPRSPFANGIRYIHDRGYRRECMQDESYCQEEVIHASFRLLHRSTGRCGDLQHGLGMYGSGSCRGSRQFVRFINSYSEQVRLKSVLLYEQIGSQYGENNY